MPSIATEKRTLSRVFVVCPEGLADKRWKRISKELAEYQPALPPIERISVNKNHLDFKGASRSKHMRDDRNILALLKLRLNLVPKKLHFESLYARHFREHDQNMNRIYPGELACSIAHINIWHAIDDQDDLCLVLEDDASLLPGMNPSEIIWPKDAHLLHLLPESVAATYGGNEQFKPILVGNYGNWKTIGYLISAEGAKFIREKLLPFPIDLPVDCALFERRTPGFRPFVTCENAILEITSYKSMVRHAYGERTFNIIKRSFAFPFLSFFWRLLMPRFVKRFIGGYFGR